MRRKDREVTSPQAIREIIDACKVFRVAFMGEDSISVVVSAMENGMTDADAARIGEIVKEQTGLNADQIKIIEAE